jgi:glycolate oxidase
MIERVWRTRAGLEPAMRQIALAWQSASTAIAPSVLPVALRRLERLARHSGLRVATAADVGAGHLHPFVCYDPSAAGEAEAARELSETLGRLGADLHAAGAAAGA